MAENFNISLVFARKNNGLFWDVRVSCLHLPCFVADFVYVVFDFVFEFQACVL